MRYGYVAVVAAFLATSIPATGQESPLLTGRLNPGEPILPRVLARLQRDHDALLRFSFREASRLERRDTSGELRSSENVVSEVFYDEGRRMRRSLQPGRTDDSAATPAKAERDPAINLENLAACFDFDPVGPETLDGKPALKLAFAARAGCMSEGGRAARILGQLAGDLWLDVEEFELLRLKGNLRNPVTFGFGLLGRIDRFDITLRREAVSPGVFAVTQIDYHARGRAFPGRRFNLTMTRDRSQFRADAGAAMSSATSTPSQPQTSDRDRRPRDQS